MCDNASSVTKENWLTYTRLNCERECQSNFYIEVFHDSQRIDKNLPNQQRIESIRTCDYLSLCNEIQYDFNSQDLPVPPKQKALTNLTKKTFEEANSTRPYFNGYNRAEIDLNLSVSLTFFQAVEDF